MRLMGLLRGVAAVKGAIRVIILIIPHLICQLIRYFSKSKISSLEAVRSGNR